MGKSRKRYNDKKPVPHALAPREHYTKKNGSWKSKMSFDTEASADNWVAMHSSLRLTWRVYECPVCHKYHLGSIRNEDDDEE